MKKEEKQHLEAIEKATELLQTTDLKPKEIAERTGLSTQKVVWIRNHKAQEGLGDKVEKITKLTGIKALVEMFSQGEDCGCDERKAKLNARLRLKVQRCPTWDELDYLDRFFLNWDGNTGPEFETLDQLAKIRNKIYSLRYSKPNPTCIACVKQIINPLRTVYDEYIKDHKAKAE